MNKHESGLGGRNKYKLGPIQVYWACKLFWDVVTYIQRNPPPNKVMVDVSVHGYDLIHYFRLHCAEIPINQFNVYERHSMVMGIVPLVLQNIERDISKYIQGTLPEDHESYQPLTDNNITPESLLSVYLMRDAINQINLL